MLFDGWWILLIILFFLNNKPHFIISISLLVLVSHGTNIFVTVSKFWLPNLWSFINLLTLFEAIWSISIWQLSSRKSRCCQLIPSQLIVMTWDIYGHTEIVQYQMCNLSFRTKRQKLVRRKYVCYHGPVWFFPLQKSVWIYSIFYIKIFSFYLYCTFFCKRLVTNTKSMSKHIWSWPLEVYYVLFM